MNLNISTNIMDYFQGNTNIVDGNFNKNEFSGLFEMLEESFGNISSELDINIEDSEKNIDYEMIQNILSSLNTSNLNGNYNVNFMSTKSEADINDLIDVLNNLDSDKLVDDLLLNNNQEVLQTLENIQTNSIEDVQTNFMKNIQVNSIEDIANMQSDKIDNDIDNQINNIIDVINIEESYNKLEISSLSNKGNLLNDTKSELESILDEDFNDFIGFNNVVNEVENKSIKANIESAPIREVRQEAIGDDIVQTVRYLKENGLEEIKVKINPRELGEMTIKIMKSLEETRLSITISNEDIYDLVNKNVSEITKHLNNLDINVKEVFVDVKSNNEHLFSDNLNQEFNKNNKNNGKQKKNKLQHFKTENIDNADELEIKDNNLNILI